MTPGQSARLKTVDAYSVRRIRAFASLPTVVVRDLDAVVVPLTPQRGEILFSQNDKSSGVYFLFSGGVKLTTVVSKTKTALLRIARSGEFLGLSAAVAQRPYIATARVLENSHIAFVPGEELKRLMGRHSQLAVAVSERLADDCVEALTEMLLFRVTSTTLQRLTRLILRWSRAHGSHPQEIRIPYTQAEIGQLIGASRETVTRLMTQLERKGIISVSHSQLSIVDPQFLKRIAGPN